VAPLSGASPSGRNWLELGKAREHEDRGPQVRDAFSAAFPARHQVTPS
jgi:hypothetical protein